MSFPKKMGGWLEFSREAILSGQVWRLLTTSFTHTNLNHQLLNLGALAALLHHRTPAGQAADGSHRPPDVLHPVEYSPAAIFLAVLVSTSPRIQ